MANPNLKNLTQVYGQNSTISGVPAIASGIVACSGNQVLKINSLYISNIVNVSTNLTVDLHDGSSQYYFCKDKPVASGETINLIRTEVPVYVTENQSLRILASSSGALSALVSYERIS